MIMEDPEKKPHNENKMMAAWLTLALAFLIIIFFPAIQHAVPFLSKNTKTYSVFGLFKQPETPDTTTIPELPFDIDSLEQILQDSLVADSISQLAPDTTVAVNKSTTTGLTAFQEALSDMENGKKKKVRILWFGDSMIEGDLITQDVRDSLQRHFGGSGIGYVPITSVVAGFRTSIRTDFSDNWKYQSIVMRKSKPVFPLNWNGEYFTALRDTTNIPQGHQYLSVTYKPGNNFSRISTLPNPVLLYGRRQQDSTCINEPNYAIFQEDTMALDGRQIVNVLPFENSDPKQVDPGFLLKPDQPIYGMSFESDEGIILDNFAMRGNSGMVMANISRAMYRSYASKMGADLVVIHYGVNAMALGMTKYSWYRYTMIRVIEYMKESLPEASFLILSIADRASKQEGIMQTDSSVYAMNKVLAEVAEKTGSAYFDLFTAMGGTGSIVDWVERGRPLANKDYTHFNFRGSKKVANLIVDFLLEEYRNYLENEAMPDHEPGVDTPGIDRL